MTKYSIPYRPLRWTDVEASMQARFQSVDVLLQASLKKVQLTYAQLAEFAFQSTEAISVRPSIIQFVAERPKQRYSMVQEKACLDKAIASPVFPVNSTIYRAALAIRSILFQRGEPLRKTSVHIAHTPWMEIAPPLPDDFLFSRLSDHANGPGLFNALNVYLITLATHPFTDGNGRVSRVLFNLHLARKYGGNHFVPLAELTATTYGLYEEYLVTANETGHYDKLVSFLLSLLETYTRFLEHPTEKSGEGDLARAQRLASKARAMHQEELSINDKPPYPISMKSVLKDHLPGQLNIRFVNALIEIAQALAHYGELAYAITNLQQLTINSAQECGSVAFFIRAKNKEALILRARDLRQRYAGIATIQFALFTDDPVMDAKLTIILSAMQLVGEAGRNGCSVILHDFEYFDTSAPVQWHRAEVCIGNKLK